MRIKSFIKILVSILMLVIVLRVADLEGLKTTLYHVRIPFLLSVIAGYSCGQVLSAFKWWLLATSGGHNVPFQTALKAYFIGMFVNCFGLGMVGGDVARGLIIGGDASNRTVGLASVVADRTHGLAVLAFLGTVCAITFGRFTFDAALIYFLCALGGAIVCGWFFGPWALVKLTAQNNALRQKALEVSRVFPKMPSRILIITAVSCIFHLLQISLHAVMAAALSVTVPWGYLLVAIPFVNIVSSLPISWNGLGVRENAYVFFLVPALLTREQAVAFGAMWLLAVTVSSAIGGIVSVVSKDLMRLNSAAQNSTFS